MKHCYWILPMLLVSACATEVAPEPSELTIAEVDGRLAVQGTLFSQSTEASSRRAEALAAVYSKMNDANLGCQLDDYRLTLTQQARGQYQVDYLCAQAKVLSNESTAKPLALSCEAPDWQALEQDVLIDWEGRKLPFSGYRGTLTIVSEQEMPEALARNWATQTILAKAEFNEVECTNVVINPVRAECANYAYLLECVNL